MKKCPYCKSEFDDALSYCPMCGATYSEEAVQRAYTEEINKIVAKEKKSSMMRKLFVLGVCVCIAFFAYLYFQSQKGTLSTNIANGKLYVNGEFKSYTPCNIELSEGTYKIKIVSGNEYWKGNVVIYPQEISKPVGDITSFPKPQQVKKKPLPKKVNVQKASASVPYRATSKPKEMKPKPKSKQQQRPRSNPEQDAKKAAQEAARQRREENLRRIQQ